MISWTGVVEAKFCYRSSTRSAGFDSSNRITDHPTVPNLEPVKLQDGGVRGDARETEWMHRSRRTTRGYLHARLHVSLYGQAWES